MSERALSFGSVAAAYERFRPGYPDAVTDLLLDYAGRPLRTALEIGAGTGKATRLLASHGLAVTASEPDAEMLDELRRQVPAERVTPVQSRFEDLPTTQAYDLVLAAAALHWTRPEGRWERIAALLVPGGVFASMGGPFELVDAELDAAVVRVRQPWLADDGVPSPDGTPADSPLQWPGTELTASPLFTDVRQEVVPRRLTVAASDYVGYLSTVSAYLGLAADVRSTVLDRIREVLPARVELVADITVHLARRV